MTSTASTQAAGGETRRTVLITGASRGIGAATALAAAAGGWDVAVHFHRQEAAARRVADQVRALGRRAEVFQADLADASQIPGLFAAVDQACAASGSDAGQPSSRLSPLGALVNNAGVLDVAARVEDFSAERLSRIWATNLTAPVLCAAQAVKRFSTRHGGPGGVIVNLSSAAARVGSPGVYLDYSMSKAAIDHFSIGLAREVALEGIRVAAVRPGIIDTDIHASGGHRERVEANLHIIPQGRLGTAEEVAQAIVWLMSDAASYTTGAVLDVAGGR